MDPDSGLDVYMLEGPYGPYIQLGKKPKKGTKVKGKIVKPKRASIPKSVVPEDVTLEMALKYISLPRVLGEHPETGETISANIGRFGPYIVHEKDFRSLKEDDPHKIELPRALEILAEPKKRRGRKRS